MLRKPLGVYSGQLYEISPLSAVFWGSEMGEVSKVSEELSQEIGFMPSLFGNSDENLHEIEQLLRVRIMLRNDGLSIEGERKEDVEQAKEILSVLAPLTKKHWHIDVPLVRYLAGLANRGELDRFVESSNETVLINHKGRPIRCRTLGQVAYVSAIRSHELTFGVGPAGTGKTYLAMALAVGALKNHDADRIILTRPAVEAGEKLGFLPGDFAQKVDPYLRPLYDAMIDMLGAEACSRMQERGIIEVAPLAYMRGRTLSNAFIILDEAQNTTREQMKMFLTRIGSGSRVVVTGDLTQIDLPRGKRSGLDEAVDVLDGIDEIAIVRLTNMDVVRHTLVQSIVQAYERYGNRETGGEEHAGIITDSA